jgi:GPH family glycoside/pentoside/hexuronide:cation symporter
LIALLVGVACSTALTKRMGKRSLFRWSMLLTGILCRALFFLPATAHCADHRPGSSAPVLLRLLRPGAVGHDGRRGRLRRMEDGTPRHRHGDSAVVFALWVGVALGGAIAGWLLDLYGYSSNGRVQSARALDGIRLTASVYSGAAFLAAAVCLLFYGIDMKLNLTISNELAERRKGVQSPIHGSCRNDSRDFGSSRAGARLFERRLQGQFCHWRGHQHRPDHGPG